MSTTSTCQHCETTAESCAESTKKDHMIEHSAPHIQGFLYYLQALFVGWPIKTVFASIAAFFGTEQILFIWLFVMLAADLGFGLVESIMRKRFSCKVLARGVVKIPAYCLYIFLVGAMDMTVEKAIHLNMPFLELFIAYLVSCDAVSVMGHAIRLGMPMPKRIRRVILHTQLKVEGQLNDILDSKKKPSDSEDYDCVNGNDNDSGESTKAKD